MQTETHDPKTDWSGKLISWEYAFHIEADLGLFSAAKMQPGGASRAGDGHEEQRERSRNRHRRSPAQQLLQGH